MIIIIKKLLFFSFFVSGVIEGIQQECRQGITAPQPTDYEKRIQKLSKSNAKELMLQML